MAVVIEVQAVPPLVLIYARVVELDPSVRKYSDPIAPVTIPAGLTATASTGGADCIDGMWLIIPELGEKIVGPLEKNISATGKFLKSSS